MRNYGNKRKPRINVKKIHDGNIVWDSKLERERWGQLQLLEKAGEISDLKLKPHLTLTDAEIGYSPDYSYVEDGRTVWEDAKGFETERFRMIKKLWRFYGPGPLRITKRDKRSGRIVTAQIIHARAS